MRAFCYASGEIGFGPHIPEGALPIARGRSKPLQDFISVQARHAYDGKTLLVPGIPEAGTQDAGLDALHRFIDWCSEKSPKGVTMFGHRS